MLLRAIAQDSVPEFGSFARYRAAPRDSLLSIVPVDGAEFIRNQRFDVSVEFHALGFDPPSMEELKITINGETAEKALGKPVEAVETWNFTYAKTLKALDRKEFTSVAVSRVAIRSGKLQRPGRYTVKVSVAGHNLEAEWIVRKPSKRSVKNVILMIGDGMASSMISAARMISKPTKFGKFQDNVLNLEKLGGSIGKIITNGIDSIMTDSANSAASYNSGHKGWSSSLNVYADTSESPLDDPKVETIAEYIRSYRPQMCIGIVTTAEIQDATPAAVYSHTRSRYDKDKITDQALNGFTNMNISWDPLPVKSDVLFGGGGSYFCNDHPGCKSFNKRDFYQEFKELGYSVVNNKEDLEFQKGDKPILGIFNSRTMDTWIDRNIYPKSQNKNGDPQGETKQALNQPGLEEMAIKAIEILEARCSDGFYLMIEAASIDKAMHVLDYDRGLGELLELDRTVKLVNDWRIDNIQNFDTALIVTSDHAQAYDVVGVVDTEYLSELPEHDNIFGVELKGKQNDLQYFKRRALGIYEYAGWPDLVTDSTGLPNNWEGRYRLWGGKVDNLQHREEFKVKKNTESQLLKRPPYQMLLMARFML